MLLTSPSSSSRAVEPLLEVLRGRRVVVLSGAGCSTESGIPDYRGPEGSLRNRQPIRYQEFVGSAEARVRYWARSAAGWPRIAAALPNAAHHALSALESAGIVRGTITQNVDGLHGAAGSVRVVELHGSLDRVRCLECGEVGSREAFQERLRGRNPEWFGRLEGGDASGGADAAPDGDAELSATALRGFAVPPCAGCRGVIKPDVVFFGENVPRDRVERAWRLYEDGDLLLVVGSSLQVYSGRRFIYRARDEAVPIVIANLGPTRADEFAIAKVEGKVGEILPALAAALLG
jgi:NAD+-dependent protein deacetylase sirtuin 4